jgi:hypothetical protein
MLSASELVSVTNGIGLTSVTIAALAGLEQPLSVATTVMLLLTGTVPNRISLAQFCIEVEPLKNW